MRKSRSEPLSVGRPVSEVWFGRVGAEELSGSRRAPGGFREDKEAIEGLALQKPQLPATAICRQARRIAQNLGEEPPIYESIESSHACQSSWDGPMTDYRTKVALLSAMALLLPSAAAQNAEQLAKQTQNPIASLVSVPFQGNWDFGIGDRNATGTLLNFQPVMPFPVSKSTNVIVRVIAPLTSQPLPDGTRVNGVSDVLTTAFFSPSKAGNIIWGAGPAILLPTATNNSLGTEKFAIGPSVVVLTQPGKWTLGALANQLWSTSGAEDRAEVNQMYVQPFANYNLGAGLAVGVSMEANAAWKADTVWTAPLLFSVSKVTLLGKQPVNIAMAAGPTLGGSENSSSWRYRLSATFLFPR